METVRMHRDGDFLDLSAVLRERMRGFADRVVNVLSGADRLGKAEAFFDHAQAQALDIAGQRRAVFLGRQAGALPRVEAVGTCDRLEQQGSVARAARPLIDLR